MEDTLEPNIGDPFFRNMARMEISLPNQNARNSI